MPLAKFRGCGIIAAQFRGPSITLNTLKHMLMYSIGQIKKKILLRNPDYHIYDKQGKISFLQLVHSL